jgi:hypothetical protein
MRLRLGRMEQIWPSATPEMPPWIPGMIEDAAGSAEVIVIRRQAWARGQRRRLAGGGPYPDHDEYGAVTTFEMEELLSLARLTPDDPAKALATWYALADGWPIASSWPFSQEQLAIAIADHRWRQEERRTCPALAPYQSEIRAEMAHGEALTTVCVWLTREVVPTT